MGRGVRREQEFLLLRCKFRSCLHRRPLECWQQSWSTEQQQKSWGDHSGAFCRVPCTVSGTCIRLWQCFGVAFPPRWNSCGGSQGHCSVLGVEPWPPMGQFSSIFVIFPVAFLRLTSNEIIFSFPSGGSLLIFGKGSACSSPGL